MSYQQLKQEIVKINDGLVSLVSKAKLLPFAKKETFRDWERVFSEIKEQIQDDTFHISVVGSIKSGKSTLVNYLFHGDYLKRGAGVTTSFITRARKGNNLKATIKLKSRKEINREIERAINGISLYEPKFKELLPFDIKDGQSVERLSSMIKGMDLNLFLKDGTQDIHYLTLVLYLKGYHQLTDMISDKEEIVIYEEKDFEEHKRFVGDDSLAIYLKDVMVEISNGIFDESVEVADCQGSDSANPLHLLMIQEYLMVSQLIIYVISSRMGIREADIKFLHILKKMGMMQHIIFVVNSDFDEHRSTDELMDIVDKTREQISLFVSDPHIFTFSALFNLLNEIDKNQGRGLTEKERSRFYQWNKERDFVELSQKETLRFLDYLKETLSQGRYAIFVKSWLERLYLISSDIRDWISLNVDMVTGDKAHSKELIQKLREHRSKLDNIRSLLINTLEGSSNKLKENIRRRIDQFFDKEGELLSGLKQFSGQFQISHDRYEDMLHGSGISHGLYLVFREYKKAMDIFIVQNVNPLIIRFLKEVDEGIKNDYTLVLEPYHDMLLNAISDLRGDSKKTPIMDLKAILNLEHIKRRYNIRPPSIMTTMEYNILLTPEAIMRFGMYRLFNFIKKIFKKDRGYSMDERIRVLQEGLSRIKRQGLDSIIFNLTNYKENMKYQYAFLLIDTCKKHIVDSINEQIKNGLERFLIIEEEIKREQFDKESTLRELNEMRIELDHILSHIEKLGDSESFIHLLK
ncbi:MAG: hypothetical protein DRG39_02615 [Deltaproteobacteria bacterium]|nr:MAG: hypothetical protein DRG39_02615 [Deltaproteobacteria bacterium]